jgi:hypothetical protein
VTCALLLDEMLSPKIAGQLRQRGHDAYAITERPDLVGLSDEQVLALGTDEGRIVVTLNIADFAALHSQWQAQGRRHRGLVYVSTVSFPQDHAFLGSLVASLDKASAAADLPAPDETSFLSRGQQPA